MIPQLFKIVKARMIRIIDGVKKTGWVARMLTNGTVTIDDLVEEASINNSANSAEIRMALDLCMQVTGQFLANGFIVDLGPLGKLYPTTNSKWVENEEDLELMYISTDVRFVPSAKLLKGVHSAEKAWASKKDKDKQTTEEAAGDTQNTEHQTTDSSTGTIDSSTGTVDTSTGNNNSGDDIPTGNG